MSAIRGRWASGLRTIKRWIYAGKLLANWTDDGLAHPSDGPWSVGEGGRVMGVEHPEPSIRVSFTIQWPDGKYASSDIETTIAGVDEALCQLREAIPLFWRINEGPRNDE
jgi:hypothetical protein